LVPADKYLPLNDELIPTGEIASIENTPFDFRKLTRIGERVNESFDGYDMMFIIDGEGKRPFGK
jgi:aldose 1-epimerase